MAEQQFTFGELVKAGDMTFGDGYRTKKSEHGKPGLPILRVAEVQDGTIRPEFTDYVSDAYRAAMGAKVSRCGDVVLTTKGTVGRVAIIPSGSPEFIYSPQVCFFRVSEEGRLDSKYLYYWFKTPEFWDQAGSRKSQTDMADYLNLSDIRSLAITVPGRVQQQAVVNILGALDDKISSNDRMIAVTLELADAQYAHAVQGLEFGPETFGSVATVVGGGTPSTKAEEYWGGGIAWATPTDVTALSAPYLFETSRTITSDGLENCASQLYPAHSIFMTSRATIGAFALPQMPAAVNQGFIVVLPPAEELRWWLLHEMRSRVDEMISLANGSTFLELSRKNFKAMPIRLADDQAVAEFAQAVSPLHGRAAQAAAESRALAALRDTLLPQLMSGKLCAHDAEKIVEDAV
ncbi:restriction endonuclease subunit S [Streptomyces sp. HF10]|uniref:restriction endonuclease subunit S n=1 Tax=Streptomyces sp. HF10 TaxID=2692233 RepID=UPI001316FD26|nr:restriction endonuclease subunit S [Streptomyces sp. HF10]QHC30583.1 restriction endonuclease subunit S [Streptomyces sp. HF10]